MIKYKEKIKKYSKYMTILNFIKFCLSLCGHYVTIHSAKAFIYVHKVFCIAFAAVIINGTIARYNITHFFGAIEYSFSIALSLVVGDEYLSRFYRAIKTNDVMMGRKRDSIFDDVTKLIVLVFITVRLLFAYTETYIKPVWEYRFFSVTFMTFANRVDCLILTIILYTLYDRTRLIRRRFEAIPIPVNIINEVGVMCKVREVRRCLQHYHNLLDILMDINREFQYLLYIIMVFSVPKNVYYIYKKIKIYLKSMNTAWLRIFQILDNLEGFCYTCMPAVIAELIKYEVEKLMRALCKQLLRCSDESLRFELQRALQYITIRPFEYMLWGAVPVDISFPVNLISLCITYVIVIIQFVNFNDIL